MSDAKKTKQELLKEIFSLRRKLTLAMKGSKTDAGNKKKQVRRYERHPLDVDIEFIGDFDIVKAKGVNISKGGICMQMKSNMPFELKMYQKNKLKTYRAELVWLRQHPNGEYHFGFRFIDDKPLPEF